MAISSYFENGIELWKVYVHVRSSADRNRRIQKTITGLRSEIEARREEKKIIQQISKNVQAQDNLGMLWENVINLWWQDVKLGMLFKVSERSAEGYMSIINKWTESWMKLHAGEIGRAEGRELIIRLQKASLSKAYQKKVKNMINSVYEWGVEFKHIKGRTEGPLRGLALEQAEDKVPDILSLEEIKKLLMSAKVLSNPWYPVWAFAVLTGMRSGELHALTWDQVDLEKGIIIVDRSYDSNMKISGPTKGRYWRTVPISSNLRSLIVELLARPESRTIPHVLPRIKDWDNGDQAVPLKNFLRSIKVKPVKFHALRACFATQMLASGVSAPIVMKIGGWKKSSTMDIYLRLAGVDTKGATECLEFIPSEINFADNVISIFERRTTND
jgi:integrase